MPQYGRDLTNRPGAFQKKKKHDAVDAVTERKALHMQGLCLFAGFQELNGIDGAVIAVDREVQVRLHRCLNACG